MLVDIVTIVAVGVTENVKHSTAFVVNVPALGKQQTTVLAVVPAGFRHKRGGVVVPFTVVGVLFGRKVGRI